MYSATKTLTPKLLTLFINVDQKVPTTPPGFKKRANSVWGMSCGSGVSRRTKTSNTGNEDIREKLMIHGIGRNKRLVVNISHK